MGRAAAFYELLWYYVRNALLVMGLYNKAPMVSETPVAIVTGQGYGLHGSLPSNGAM
jgi:hypothetical protein